ncbi:hypothetical protein HRR80_001018 [Exophiala dermatitidis]|uniref:Uncharacterized protein n=2 Tax=Exophiala dermatitidis TaxID=5970 RepID=H6C7S5_EXODN|nr:uncharacterized protein HMPREF1120_07700 [Exophiala dermatitidis NIH/UT8656]KAJ4532963.1 hypothetical protein HRR76_007934 [Exophiala dermatitidis]EHY59717.1 hypothetical protein HMPREF1120_07700 [Exophiala dermatitidis NIH/UT8656]KAJ4538766.1 hypothetical protein HRR77_006697 [Exophiala dermatitidis]KAJ4574112.1 hypothetical protein HRR79_003107 [Exophiala dermatitidis]KAJ4583629.1 hypothetical protein HRR82_002983 [Exophiala dermatitidis]
MLSRFMGMNKSCSSRPGPTMEQLNDISGTDTDTLSLSSASDLSPECPETNNDMNQNHGDDSNSDDSSSAEYHDFSESGTSTGSTPSSPSSLIGEYGSDMSDSEEIGNNGNDCIYSQMLHDLANLSEMCTASESYAQHVERKLEIAIDQLADQEQEIESLTTGVENAKTATETLQTELEKGKKKAANLKTENISLKKQLEQSGVSSLKKKLNDANRERDAAREEVNRLKQEMETISDTNTKTNDLNVEQLISRLNKKLGNLSLDGTETDAEAESESDAVSVSSSATTSVSTSGFVTGHEQQQLVTIVIALLMVLKTNLSDLNRRVGESRADHVNDAFTMLLALENRVKETTGRLIREIEACLLSMTKRS